MATATTTQRAQGKIGLCPHQGCGFTCCDFAAGNYIALYPGELDEAANQTLSIEHLEIWPDEIGGHRARCNATDCSTCDGGYKPLDCASYPYFPNVDSSGEIRADLKGAKCPLTKGQTITHRSWVRERWSGLASVRKEVRAWLQKVRLVGYQSLTADE